MLPMVACSVMLSMVIQSNGVSVSPKGDLLLTAESCKFDMQIHWRSLPGTTTGGLEVPNRSVHMQ